MATQCAALLISHYPKTSSVTLLAISSMFLVSLLIIESIDAISMDDPNALLLYFSHNQHKCVKIDERFIFPADAPVVVHTDVTTGGNRRPVYGEPMTLLCPLESNPPSNYTWKRYSINGSVQLNISRDIQFTENDRQLLIDAYQPDAHNGLYMCQASNGLGSREYTDWNLFLLNITCKSTGDLLVLEVALSLGLSQLFSGEHMYIKATCNWTVDEAIQLCVQKL